MNFQGLIPVIQCQSIDQTLVFYEQALRYIILQKTVTDDGLQWAYLASDETLLMLQKNTKRVANPPESGNILLHYYTSDIETQYQFMRARGFEVSPIETTPYHMQQFFVVDPEGNRITIGQNIKS